MTIITLNLQSLQDLRCIKNQFLTKATSNATIVDVRTPGEFAGQHVPGAINIPLDEVAKRVNEFKKLQKPIVAYCRSGHRSGMAVIILRQNGIDEAVNGGGIEAMLFSTNN